MGTYCELFDHMYEAQNSWGEQCQYIHFHCKRCGHDKIFCTYEEKDLPYDENGLKAMEKMMSDKRFSDACHIHSQFEKVEKKYVFNFLKRQGEFDKLIAKYGLSHQPGNPVDLLNRGMWIDLPSNSNETSKRSKGEKPKKSNPKPKGRASVEPDPDDLPIDHGADFRYSNPERENQQEINPPASGSTFEYTLNLDEDSSPKSKKSKPKVKREKSNQELLDEYEKKMFHHQDLEQYEKAAEYRDKIVKLKEQMKK